MKTPDHLGGRYPQRGVVALVFGLTLVVLIGFAGLAIDFGRFFVIKSELQNAVDACALAAASQLRPGLNDPAALIRAVAYGRVFATGGSGNNPAIKNRANFQSDVVAIVPDQITFSDTPNGSYQSSASANYNTANYAKCSYPLAGLPVFFLPVLNPQLSTQTVAAMAVARSGIGGPLVLVR
jgi:Flp pilus assembly protein TadG